MSDIKFIIGLGNPGEKYTNTRHNFGFKAVDKIISLEGLAWKNWNDMAGIAFYTRNQKKILFAKPMTFMNNSGFAVSALLKYYKITPAEMLVIYDDFSIPAGEFRFRTNGSSGGHNGVNSIINQTATKNFPRMKLGIGPLANCSDTADFVLNKFSGSDEEKVEKVLNSIKDIVDLIIDLGFDKAVSKIALKKD
ncbi:MAG: aminoacyl-tRNA hydrolase [Endomicrobiaceae bacterium]|nr:aminoacyl-tRNA hydrolase [Endomicrobiaceae bacterium]